MTKDIRDLIVDHNMVVQAVLEKGSLIESIEEATKLSIDALQKKGTLFFCGNGGSAADAQHIAAELTGFFYKSRPPLKAVALGTNFSHTTAVANDAGYKEVFARQVEAFGQDTDVLIALSTSGNSSNVVQAAVMAKKKGMSVIAMTGQSPGALEEFSDVVINVPSTKTPRIQEMHILIGHIFCQLIENHLFPNEN